MKRIIYKPAIGDAIPGPDAMQYTLPVSGFVIDVLVDNAFTPLGVVIYDSLVGVALPEPFFHHFSGWEA